MDVPDHVTTENGGTDHAVRTLTDQEDHTSVQDRDHLVVDGVEVEVILATGTGIQENTEVEADPEKDPRRRKRPRRKVESFHR